MAQSALRRKIAEMEERQGTAEELRLCRDRFSYFLFRWCRTQDEHDPTVFAKPFPRHDYIRQTADILQFERRICWEKSRQMMASWICCAFSLWVAMFRPNVLWFIQSKKEEDAADRLARIYVLYFRLPEWMRQRFPVNLGSGRPGQQLYTELHFTWREEDAEFFGIEETPDYSITELVKNRQVRSKLWAIPQGADVLRQYTATGVFSDEAAFQEQAGEAYTAVMPTLGKDSWLIMVSTASPGFFESIAKDKAA